MALATTQDPVQTITDLLTNASDAEWPRADGAPNDIERVEATERRVKEERSTDACYVQATVETDHADIDPTGGSYDEVAVVTVQCWTPTSAAQATALKRDVLGIAATKANDVRRSTQWVDIRPQASDDFTGQKDARRGDHYVKSAEIRLRDLREVDAPTGGAWGGTGGFTFGGVSGGTWS